MSKSALLDFFGTRQTIHHEEDGKTYLESRQEVSHIVEAAKIMADEKPGRDFRHAAFVPETVINQAFQEGWFHDKAKWKRWLNDPVNDCYRTWKGRV